MEQDKDARESWEYTHEHEIDEDFIEAFYTTHEEEQEINASRHRRAKRVRRISFFLAVLFVLNFLAFFPRILKAPSMEFLITSRKLAQKPEIKALQPAVVTIDAQGSVGTGFNIADEGVIITNHHVIQNAKTPYVKFTNGERYKVTSIERYPEIDLAVLKIKGKNLPHLKINYTPDLATGTKVNVIGNPLGLTQIVNEGTLIGFTNVIDINQQALMIRAPIYKGNSGSPVFNQKGEVIGVIFATVSSSAHVEQEEIVGLAIPIGDFLPFSRLRSH